MSKIYTIDAKGKKIGRVASEAASIIMGKRDPGFRRNVVSDIKVVIKNSQLADISEKKLESKKYGHYSGFPGGLKIKSMKQIVAKAGFGKIFEKAVWGMLPKNLLRSHMIKNLKVE